jgi:hypothetical protein
LGKTISEHACPYSKHTEAALVWLRRSFLRAYIANRVAQIIRKCRGSHPHLYLVAKAYSRGGKFCVRKVCHRRRTDPIWVKQIGHAAVGGSRTQGRRIGAPRQAAHLVSPQSAAFPFACFYSFPTGMRNETAECAALPARPPHTSGATSHEQDHTARIAHHCLSLSHTFFYRACCLHLHRSDRVPRTTRRFLPRE